ncbi:uncharacterized protein LOC121262409 [Juglans microcarpa x Juglans regia]|uniref:uncharacterized protein LOC121262409 n=1 Tax=Juglans microcarpa x Juglans regia TaxID=2249226 RepID=UPI001B7F4E69|nr:uncharacterized protein LOC121262409 [Juglans microcarpa x Juglans regia]
MATISSEETPWDFYSAGKDYRAYGPQGEHLLRQPDHLHINAVSTQRETIHADSLYLNEREYHAYGLGANVKHNPLYLLQLQHQLLLQAHIQRIHTMVISMVLHQVLILLVERTQLRVPIYAEQKLIDWVVYSTYAADALLHKDKTHHYQAARPEAVPVPVSSRYSFAGLSFLHRLLNLHLERMYPFVFGLLFIGT